MDSFVVAHISTDNVRPDVLLLSLLGICLLGFSLWCLITWMVAQINLQAALVIAPPLMRAALLASLAIGASTAAHADESRVEEISGLTLPERPETASFDGISLAQRDSSPARDTTEQTLPSHVNEPDRKVSPSAGHPQESGNSSYRVRSGDTLWSIARSQLGQSASNQGIATRVRKLHHLNRAVIGNDPDLIYPGQQLKEPHL